MKAFVDKDLCIGCGLCLSISPDVFNEGSDGKVEAIGEELSVSLAGEAEEAAQQCPVGAITTE